MGRMLSCSRWAAISLTVLACSSPAEPRAHDQRRPPAQPTASSPTTALAQSPRTSAATTGWALEIAKDGDDIVLEWPDQGPGASYEVWVSEHAYFEPTDPDAQLLADGIATTQFTHVGGDDETSRYYRVRLAASPHELSTTVGKITTALHPGYTKFGVCLLSELDTAQELFADSLSPVLSVHRWDAVAQDWAWTWAAAPQPLGFEAGEAIVVNHDATMAVEPAYYTMVGHVPAHGDVRLDLQPGDNLVATLPARADLHTASQVLAAVEHATRIGRPNAQLHTIEWFPGGADFEITPCMPLHVEVDEPSTWPPTRVHRVVGPAGAVIQAYDGAIVLDIPPGALAQDVEIQLSPYQLPRGEQTTPTIAFEPHDIAFAVPVTLTSRYRSPGTPAEPDDALASLVRFSTDGSSTVLDTSNDLADGTLTASIDTFSWIDTGLPCDASNPVAMSLSPDTPSSRVGEGDAVVITATLLDVNADPVVPAWTGAVTWAPDAADPVATVTPQALTTEAAVTPVAPGSTTVTATTTACRRVYDPVADAYDEVADWPVSASTTVVVPSCADRIAQGECPTNGCTVACTAGACDGVTPANEGAACPDDGNACTDDVCGSGLCDHFFIDCNDANECTLDSCDPVMGCVNTPDPCDDGLSCTLDLCDFATGCSNPPVPCDDQNLCTTDSCNEATGCQNTPIACSGGNTCGALACNPQVGCQLNPFPAGTFCGEDGNPCTADICDGAGSCQHPISIECAIGLCLYFGQCSLPNL